MKLPCRDCITLAMCRTHYLQELEKSEGNENHGYKRLRDKCFLLDEYFDNSTGHIADYRAFVIYLEEGRTI